MCVYVCGCAEVGKVQYACEGDLLLESTIEKIPYFNAAIYRENKAQIGKIDEILGPVNKVVSDIHLYEYLFVCVSVQVFLCI